MEERKNQSSRSKACVIFCKAFTARPKIPCPHDRGHGFLEVYFLSISISYFTFPCLLRRVPQADGDGGGGIIRFSGGGVHFPRSQQGLLSLTVCALDSSATPQGGDKEGTFFISIPIQIFSFSQPQGKNLKFILCQHLIPSFPSIDLVLDIDLALV
jgi:hypothetical protein